MESNAAHPPPSRWGRPRRQRELVLGAVALALVVTAAWRIRSAAPPATDPAATTPSSQPTTPPQQKSPVTEVDLESLKTDRPEPVDGTRDPFRFRPRNDPPPSLSPSGIGRSSPGAQNPLFPTEPPAPPPPPPIPLKFIGVIVSADPAFGRVAVLSDGRGVYHGREGDTIEGRYRIMRIGVESIELAYLDGRGRQTIAKTGQ